jgi:hypothetical protein
VAAAGVAGTKNENGGFHGEIRNIGHSTFNA